MLANVSVRMALRVLDLTGAATVLQAGWVSCASENAPLIALVRPACSNVDARMMHHVIVSRDVVSARRAGKESAVTRRVIRVDSD